MTRHDALGRLMRGVGHDVREYSLLQALLEDQFRAALRHDTIRLGDLARRITSQVDALDARRVERVELVRLLAGDEATLPATFALLSDKPRAAMETGWAALQGLVNECKRLNARNCELLMEQHAIMQRVLHGETETYAPA